MQYNWIIDSKSVEVVVARYNENLEWIEPLGDICTIYNKGDILYNSKINKVINLPNIGRESHTYLHHIIKNYDNLARITVFTQGKITDHLTKDITPLEYITNLVTSATIHGFSTNAYCHNVGIMSAYYQLKMSDKWPHLLDSGYVFGEWLTKVVNMANKNYNIPFGSLQWYKNGIFAIESNIIKKHPKSFYEKLIKFVDSHIDPEAGHYFERAWYEIFIGMYCSDE